ncbi:acetaldehyde dehydrogenase (acetylating) [Serratia liquefaciens]|jgi:acetaldehyde dehydrogenase|uniref:acetaldehyde dehydrogenase (acetylating) n=1 Tax=Serratia liquefaciens TaxID=614 RepID=UPI00035857AB|nr:acetaldehyde dehydrogenase (acetylating) [Serratia liquefaciens]AGQ31798.1 acetaldehyde dehydrogenase [Serratia liquefaciens ATCC 27592]CAI0745268.1 Acetaldehyde dehydrogenase 4 [Serratia liquefaciens]CAI0921209.1 Acetaldehyde dehydrogenase 4 [Serratia liquefaciens]CAI2052995.1 Acetaldehyde dehydrogenase 4 [Serratia liquefaciens]CAI2421169.1 Acetaldehyde dehydrogenase 4 [Serratia liquefaciens]
MTLSVAVIGTGAIGMDLVNKIHRSPLLNCGLLAGRNKDSAGFELAAQLGCPTSAGGIDAVLASPKPFDVVFDATNAMSHAKHWELLRPLGSLMIDLTPSHLGKMIVPTVTGTEALAERNVSLISCGGQASIPILHALSRHFRINDIEVVATVASNILGRATRINIDEYVDTTQRALSAFTGVANTKAILNISPAAPPAMFRVTIFAGIPGVTKEQITPVLAEAVEAVRGFSAGYSLTALNVSEGRVSISLEVVASSKVMPEYAGNLDLINSAAILVAEQYASYRNKTEGANGHAD